METLIRKLESMKAATDHSIDLLKSLAVKTEIKKGQVIGNTPWESSNVLLYIDGLVMEVVEYKDHLYRSWAMEKGFLIYNSDSHLRRIWQTIEILHNTKAFAINLRKLYKQAENEPNLYRILLEIYEEVSINMKERELLYHIKNANKRYAYFTEHYPELVSMLTDDQAADLLQIDRKYFYRIKK